VLATRIDHRREFDQNKAIDCCDKNSISHIFSTPTTQQQNGGVKRKNRTWEDMARALICESGLPKSLGA